MKKYLLLVFLTITYTITQASTPQFKSFVTQASLKNGETKGISITNKGELQLAPEIKQIFNTDEPSVWALVEDNKGKIFLSAGNEGKIFILDQQQTPRLFCQLDEIEVYALAIDSKNRLFAATSPDGKIYRISAKGTPSIFYDPPDKYIWDLLFDQNNNLYAATGDNGVIYKITPEGNSTTFYISDEPHIRCLSWDTKNNLLAGSFGNGYIYRINNSGEAFVIYDSNLKEIHQIEVDEQGTIYAAGLGKLLAIPPQPSRKPAAAKKSEHIITENQQEEDVIVDEIKIEAPRIKPQREEITESAIFKIMPNGVIKDIWDSFEENVQTMIMESNNKILVGTSKTGKLVRVFPNGEKVILLGLNESQITAFYKTQQGEILLATANMGKVYKLKSYYRKSGYYLSEVFDSNVISKWGSISWKSESPKGSTIKFFTRSGNTEKPNSTWSDWSSAYTNGESENITSYDSRFMQWKLSLSTNNTKITAKVKEINISYLQKNLPPEIFSITIYPQGEYYQGSSINIEGNGSLMEETGGYEGTSNAHQQPQRKQYVGHKIYRKGFQSVSWEANDPNNDKLIYNLFYREQNERAWKTLTKQSLSSLFSWDSQRLPDGEYYLKLVASDSVSNPTDMSLTTVKISKPFIIDNTDPQILNTKIKKQAIKLTFSFTVLDQYNPVKQVEYSIDSEDWKKVYPIDGICDSKKEKFAISTTYQGKGTHSIVIKAIDLVNNVGFSRTRFED